LAGTAARRLCSSSGLGSFSKRRENAVIQSTESSNRIEGVILRRNAFAIAIDRIERQHASESSAG
jgi:hypothetical protein